MAAFLLDAGSTVLCLHGGQARPVATSPRVTIGGQAAVTQPGGYTITGCALPPPPSGNGPCVTAQWVTAATRVTVGGVPAQLQDGQAVCAPTGTGLNVVVVQVRVAGT